MPFKDPEKAKAYKKKWSKAYNQSPEGKKSRKIISWKGQGIIVEDYNKFYDLFLSITNCQKCKKELTTDKKNTHSTKCADHDHAINDRPNIRGVICHACNSNDHGSNTSGEPNISFVRGKKYWLFSKQIQGKRYEKYFKTKDEAIKYKYEFLKNL